MYIYVYTQAPLPPVINACMLRGGDSEKKHPFFSFSLCLCGRDKDQKSAPMQADKVWKSPLVNTFPNKKMLPKLFISKVSLLFFEISI